MGWLSPFSAYITIVCECVWYFVIYIYIYISLSLSLLNFLAEKNSSQTWNLRSFRTIPPDSTTHQGSGPSCYNIPTAMFNGWIPRHLGNPQKRWPGTPKKNTKSSGENPLGIRWGRFPFKESSDLRAHSPPWSTRGKMPWLQCCRVAAVRVAKGVSKS